MIRLLVCSHVLNALIVTLACPFVLGGEVLVNGTLEASASPTGWTLDNFITDEPDLDVNVTEQIGGNASEFDNGLGLFIRPFAGNVGTYADQNLAVNSVLSQTVNASPNRTYTFSGSSRWQGDGDPDTNDGFSGGIDFLLPESPSDPDMTGTVPSPTQSYFQMEFLDDNDALIGAPIRLDLRDDQINDNMWLDHSLPGVAPANARKVRVMAAALDMVDNVSAQAAYFDSFSLRDDTSPRTERLQNANLDTLGAPLGFEVAEVREAADTLIGFRDFANHTEGGQQGLWLRAFAGGDGEIFQVVDATPGGQYEFSTWSKWEQGYSGGLEDSTTVTSIDMQFLDASDNILSFESLDLWDEDQSNDGVWRQYSLTGTAPANTDKVRVRAGATGMFNSGINPQSAFFDDLSLIETLLGVTGDYNGDGVLDSTDVDLQAAEMKAADPELDKFDHNSDGLVNLTDRTIWVKELKVTWVGDSNLDNEFNSGDLVSVFAEGKYENGEMATWAQGDWNGNMVFDSGDLVAAFSDGGYEQGPPAAAAQAPEPSSMALALLSVLGLVGVVRRRHR